VPPTGLVAQGNNGASAGTTLVLTTTDDIHAGDFICVVFTSQTSGGMATAISGISDSAGNSYTLGDNPTTGTNGGYGYCASACALAKGGKITITGPSALLFTAIVFTVTGLATTSPVDVTNLETWGIGTNSSLSTTGTLAQANELVVSCIHATSTITAPAAAGFTQIGFQSGTNGTVWVAYQITSSTAIVTCAPTWTTSRSFTPRLWARIPPQP
jgi:hypothetical protein